MNRRQAMKIFLMSIAGIAALPTIAAVIDTYCWFFAGHNITGLDYDSIRPLLALFGMPFSAGIFNIAYDY